MKKVLKGIGIFLFTATLFLSCENSPAEEKDEHNVTTNVYPTVTLEKIDVVATTYPGVNVLTWVDLKDAANYSVYRVAGSGNKEKLLETTSNPYYLDEKIQESTSYKYRIVANPDDRTVHDASQVEVTLYTPGKSYSSYDNDWRGTWAPKGTQFLNLEKYEKDYSYSNISEYSINAEVISDEKKKVCVRFPVKPYAKYDVEIWDSAKLKIENEAKETVYGVEFNDEAVVYIDASTFGDKKISVTAIPLNPLYKSDFIVANQNITIESTSIEATESGVKSKWTNYGSNSRTAYARIWFTPSSLDGEEIDVEKYSIYRSVYKANGINSIMEERGHPVKDYSVISSGVTEYYFDDSVNIGKTGETLKVQYYVVLTLDNNTFVSDSVLTVPVNADDNWKYTPDYSATSFKDIYIDNELKLNVVINPVDSYDLSLTYGAFDTYNQALVAVEKELPYTLSIDGENKACSDSEVSIDKYYAFRLVYTSSETNVLTFIAMPHKQGEGYYLVKKEGNVDNYGLIQNSPELSASKETRDDYYSSISLNFEADNANYFNVYRKISDSPSVNGDEYNFVGRYTGPSFTDAINDTELDKYIIYKVEAVGSFAISAPVTICISGLKSPNISLVDNNLSWTPVNNATKYYVYRAQTENALMNLQKSNSYNDVITNNIAIESSYASDYYYAIRAYGNSEYSQLSNICMASQKTVPSPSIYSASSSGLLWDAPSDYSGSYSILRCDALGTSTSVDDAFNIFTENPNGYKLTTVTTTSYSMNLGTSSNYKYYYAVATEVTDPILNIKYYGISDVVEISN